MGLSNVMRAALMFDIPAFLELKSTTLRLRDDHVAVDLYAATTYTVSTIDGNVDDGAQLVLRGYAGTSNITFDENGNVLVTGTTRVLGPNDTLWLRYDKAAGKWHEIAYAQH